jgi:amino acid adenylation domain-containing protein
MTNTPDRDDAPPPSYGAAIAIVGMSGRFPGARNVRELWSNIRNGVESVTRFKPEELEDSFSEDVRNGPDYVPARAVLDDVDMFEPEFFGMHSREASLTDPQHRLLLECAWEALEDAGYDPKTYKGPIGVFAGAAFNSYLIRHVCADRAAIEEVTSNYQVGSYAEISGSLADFLATRVAYKLDLKGPAINVQSACSTSAVAVVQACQSLLLYQSDMALAGGVSITFPQKRGYQTMEGGIVSHDGRCRPFDADADGTIFGAGAGVVLLKRLDDAIADGDEIYAVIRGFGINNDGSQKIGFTAPSVEGQAAAIAAAHAMAEIDASSIGYVECHGTATPLGDPIEFNGLVKAFRATTDEKNFCVLGAVKANFGHLDAAAGVTGLIKTALVLKAAELPPLVNFAKPNARIDVASSPFKFVTEATPWGQGETPRRAGASSFGMGGTNVHLVLEEAPQTARDDAKPRAHILPLSARTPDSLERMAANLAAHLEQNPTARLADVAHTLQIGRRAFDHRLTVAAATIDEAIAQLKKKQKPRTKSAAPKVVFMFPGQGAQYPGMGRALYESEPIFRDVVDRGALVMKQTMGVDLTSLLYDNVTEDDDAPHPIRSTVLAQPALFVIEYATARVLMDRGIEPHAMIGHSLGEFVAACLAGVFSFEDGLRLVCARGRLMQDQKPGAMLAVRLSETELTGHMRAGIEIAAVNAPSLCVASGTFEGIADLEQRLTAADITHRRLHTSHAFHSAMMEDAVEGLRAEAGKVAFAEPQRRYVSAVSGTWITAEATTPDYWARHCRETVRFADALQTLLDEEDLILLEVGPGRTLTTFAGQAKDRTAFRTAIASLPEFANRNEDAVTFAGALGQLWCEGVNLDWSKLGDADAKRTSLPTYAFARKRYWVEGPQPAQAAPAPIAQPIPAAPVATVAAPQPTQFAQSAAVQPSRATAEQNMTDRSAQIQGRIRALFEELSGESLADASPSTGFVELGFDSLFLGQVVQRLQKAFGVKITFRQLMKDYPTLDALTAFVAKNAKPETLPAAAAAPAPQTATPMAAAPVAMQAAPMAAPVAFSPTPMPQFTAAGSGIESVFQSQLVAMQQLIGQQLQAMQAIAGNAPMQMMPAASASPVAQPAPAPVAPLSPMANLTPLPVDDTPPPSRFQMYRPGGSGNNADEMTPEKRAFIDDLVRRYTEKTPTSKKRTQASRAVLADPRSANGFRAEWKEMVYPLHVERSKGSKLVDVDGNEYIDLVNGFGQTMFGHAPDFVVEAVEQQMKDGFAIGPQTPLAGEVAQMFADMTGNERVTFCNTGSEAVMAAMRVARTVTGREKIVTFNNSYHGQFDEVLVKPGAARSNRGSMPVAPGIPQESVDNIIVLPYGTPETLAWIRANANELAAVMSETVQSRHPHLRPREFLAELRTITEESGTALIFDEVVTGFRVHPGGMQHIYGIKADMATYGKVVGGGMPVGVLAGKAQFMDALDGGFWQYGDDSVPETAPTFFAGTFVRHPLVMAACRAVLRHLKDKGTALQDDLAERMRRLVTELNGECERHGLKTRFESYSSWCVVNFAAEDPLASLLYAHMRLAGVHVLEGFPWFLTTAHTDADTARIARAFRESLDALRAAGIFGAATQSSSGKSVAQLSTARASGDTVPMTEAQAEVWLAAQLGDEASCAYNESGTLTLEGDLQVTAFTDALNDVVERHDILRMTVDPSGEHLNVKEGMRLDVPFVDASGDVEPEARLTSLVAQEARTPFDLERGPLCRAILVKLAPQKHAFVFTGHHIACDGWSMGIIMSDLSAFYAARVEGTELDLPPAMPFAKYAKDRAKANPDDARIAKFWKQEFKDIPAPLELPSDRPRPSVKTFHGATYGARYDAALVSAVKKAGQRQGATLFATLFAALQVTLAKLSGQRDMALVVPMAGQTLLEDEILVGHAVDFLPIRVPMRDDESFATFLTAVKTKVMAAMEHQGYTYGTLLKQLDIKRSPNRTPITDVQFNLEKIGAGLAFSGLKCSLRSNPKAFVNFDLFFNMTEDPEGIRVDVDYSTDLYDESTIARWVDHIKTVLAATAQDSSRVIADYSLLSEADTRWLIDDLNATAVPYPRDNLIHELVTAQTEATPDAVAFECEGTTLTYAALEARSNDMAKRLAALVPDGGERIAVALPRSLDLPVALLAVLKSGNAYVPLDPTHPPARLKQTLEAADTVALICADDETAALAGEGVEVWRTDRPAPELHADRAMPRRRDATSSAYVIFTSGSTGTPKGVEVTHRAVVNFMLSMAKAPGFTKSDTIIAVTTISFDIAGLELFLPLLTGGRAVIADREQVRSGTALVELADSAGATVLQATPSLWRLLLEAGLKPRPGLKMLCGGEPLPRDLANRLCEGGGELWNVYGPTETTIWSSTGQVTAGDHTISIGDPIANTQIHILDARDQLVPVGVIGDVYIGGDGLARGYFNRPDLTAAAFRSIALAGRPAQTLYKTGDVGRRRADGSIQLLGRKDQQIKLRGYRIELEDIESHLRRTPGLADAAVALHTAEDDARLVGYYVTADTSDASTTAIVRHLATKLPDYMIPTIWQRLDALPMTANGKLNRNALPPVRTAAPKALPATAPAAVTGVFNQTIARIWADLLGREDINAETHFFEAGGHSLLGMRMITRLQQALDRPVTIAELFRAPKFGDFVRAISVKQTDPDAGRVVRIQPFGTRTPVIVLNNAWSLFPLSKVLGPDQPMTSIQFVDRTITEPKPATEWASVVDEAVRLIRRAQPHGEYILAGHCVMGAVALEAARRLAAEGEKVKLVALLDTEPNRRFKGIPLANRIYNAFMIDVRRTRWSLGLWLEREVNMLYVLGRYPTLHRLGLIRLASWLGLKERWYQEDFHTQHVVDAWVEHTSTPYDGDVVVYRARPHDKLGFLDRWLPWVPSWKSIIGDRLIVECVKVEHGEMYHDNGAALIGKHLKQTLETLDEKARLAGAPTATINQAAARKTKTGAEAA